MSFSYQEKLNIIQFYEKHGMEAALDYVRMQGVNLGQSTLYGWLAVRNKARCHSQSEFAALNPKSTKPYKQRTSNIPSVFIEFIKAYRKKRFGAGKEKLATIINQASSELSYAMNIKVEYGVNLYRLPKISSSSIGRIIDSLKKSGGIVRNAKEWNKQKLVYLDGRTGTVKRRKPIDRNSLYGKKKSRKPKDYKPSQVGDLIQLDAVTIQVPIMNSTTGVVATKKVYFVCGIDIVSRLAYSYCYSTLNSTSTTDFIQRFQLKLTKLTKQKVTIKNIQTDNGQENHKHFITHLNKQGINQFFNYIQEVPR